MKKHLRLSVLLFLAGSLLPAALFAESGSLARIRQRDRLIVGSNMVFPTLNFQDPATGRNEGFLADLGRAVAKDLLGDETKIEFHKTGEDTRFNDVNSVVVDVLIDTIPVSDEKLKIVDFSNETLVSGSALLVKAGSPIKTIADIKPGTRVAFGSANPDVKIIKEKVPGATYLEFEKSPDAVAALKDGRADVFTQVVTHLFRAASQNPGYVLTGRFTTKSYAMVVRKGDAELQAYLNGFLKKFRASGEYDRLYRQWFGAYGGENVR